MKHIRRVFLFLILLVMLNSCDKGIEPADQVGPSGFGGTVTFKGNWPEGITRTHLVVFKSEVKTVSDFFLPNLSFVIDSIPNGAKSFTYNSIDNPFSTIFTFSPGSYSYVVVAQQKTKLITFERKDWFVVGVYCINGDQTKPKTILVMPGKITNDVNILVDFGNPPPQPPM